MISSLTFLWNKNPEIWNMKYVIKNMKFEIWLPHSLSCEANFIWYKNLIWGLANVNIKSIANSNQANLANITWSSICVNLQTYIQIQSEFQGYDQLTSVHTMSTLVQIFFCIEGWDKAIMQRRTINGMPERWIKNFLRTAPVFLFFYQWSSILRSRCSLVISCSGWLLVIFR